MTQANDKPEAGHQNPHEKLFYFMDAKKVETEKTSLTGLEIKQTAGVPGDYQLFLEVHGNDPDRAISDTESFTITKPPLHFYSVPPATFGRK